MKRDEALKILMASQGRLGEFCVKSLAIFGSVARDEATESSDVDVLGEFDEESQVGLFTFIRLKQFLAELLGCTVDLVTAQALRQEMREQILPEAIHAA